MQTFDYDYIIIGSGPAGLASAQYASRGGLKTLVLESMGYGGQVMQISELENYPGLFPSINGADYILTMKNQAEAFGATIINQAVTSIDKLNNVFVIKTRSGEYKSKCVCLATGAIHKNLNVPGEKEFTGRGVSYCAVCDGPFFKNKRIVVVGGGDSACSEASYLTSISNDVSIIHRRDSFRAQKAVVDNMIEKGVKPIFDCIVKKINGSAKVSSVTLENVKTGQVFEKECDAVFIFTGMEAQTSLVQMLSKDENGYIITNEKMETAIPGLYVAGDVRAKSFRQIVTAVSDGAIAANSAKEFINHK